MDINMPVSWKEKSYGLIQVIKNLESIRENKVDGKAQFDGFAFKQLETILYGILNFSSDIPEIDSRNMLSKALINRGGIGEITQDNLLDEVKKLEREYQSLPITRYALASSISINPNSILNNIRLGNNLIIFESTLASRFRREAQNLLHEAEQSLFATAPTNYLQLRVHVSEKSIECAARKALETIDFVRGIWNWVLNRRHSIRISFGGKSKPVNKIILGPLHTLHRPNGALATSTNWWYEPSYLGSITPLLVNQDDLGRFYKSLDHVKKKFKTLPYRIIVRDGLIRYTRALDERDWTTAFVKLWSILELLTASGGTNYDVTIRRTAYIFQERDFHHQVLQNLRDYRNSSVHADNENSEIETFLYQIKSYVENLIGFHINNRYGFDSMQEAAEFLSLPYDDNTLKHKIKLYQFAVKFRGSHSGG